jgi:hypothetical protein
VLLKIRPKFCTPRALAYPPAEFGQAIEWSVQPSNLQEGEQVNQSLTSRIVVRMVDGSQTFSTAGAHNER